MQLTYRGQGYIPSHTFISHAIDAVYRGVPYHYEVTPASPLMVGLTYRGISDVSTFVPASVVA